MPAVPESAELMQAQSIIIIHPGSFYLRIGRSADSLPVTVLHAIARRRRVGGLTHHDPFLPPSKDKEAYQKMEEARLSVSHTLQSCLQSDGRRRYATPPQQIAAFNRRSVPEKSQSGFRWIKPEECVETVVGDDVVNLDPSLDFNVHFPYKFGELNVHKNIGGSLSAVLVDLQTIWTEVLRERFQINSQHFGNYKVVLVLPDIYNHVYAKELMNLLLVQMGFGACFLIQDHVAATFGAGVGYACVVDVGDQKTSVSCVEDAVSHRNTRIRMDYGGSDIAQSFHWLLQKCAFPYKMFNENNRQDAMLIRKLKEDYCHVNLDTCGAQERQFEVAKPECVTEYVLQVGDECIVAPLSLFNPELFAITGLKSYVTQRLSTGDPEDIFDANYLRETARRNMKEALDMSNVEILKTDGDEGANAGNEGDIVVDSIENAVAIGPTRDFVVNPGQILSVDQAILQSIERCPNEETKRKMYTCILIVGGGMKFSNIGRWLQNRLSLQIPYLYRGEQLDIITCPKDMDPCITVWKGAAILSCLETAAELWIYQDEWRKEGVKVLRERAPFPW